MYDRESGFGMDCFLFLVMVLYSKLQGGAVTNDWEWGGVLQSANTDMIDGSIFQSIFWFSIPLLIGNFFQQLYNTVDSYVVGNFVNTNALAAVGASTPVINMLLGGVVKIIVNFILVGNPAINIVGAAIGTLCCYIAITLLNLIALRRKLHSKLSVPRLLAKPLLASLIMGDRKSVV